MVLTNIGGIFLSVGIFAVIGGLLGILIGICAKIFHVEEDKRVETVQSMLPGANCGGCGFPGCSGMAEAIVENGVSPTNCKPIKAEKVEEINKYLSEFKKDSNNN